VIIGVDVHAGDFVGLLYGLVAAGVVAFLWRLSDPWR
jgi:hypothetical protein